MVSLWPGCTGGNVSDASASRPAWLAIAALATEVTAARRLVFFRNSLRVKLEDSFMRVFSGGPASQVKRRYCHQNMRRALSIRNADFQSAVSQNFILQTVQIQLPLSKCSTARRLKFSDTADYKSPHVSCAQHLP